MKRPAVLFALVIAGCAAKPSSDPTSPVGSSSSGPAESTGAETSGAMSSSGTAAESSSGSPERSSSSGDGSSSSSGQNACAPVPPSCNPAKPSTRIEVTTTDAAPYLVRYPSDSSTPADVVLFMPGGPGAAAQAPITFDLWLSQGEGIDSFIVVMPYSASGNLPGEPEHVFDVLDEVLSCTCNTGRVHLGGTSNGGRLAYQLALEQPDRFVTLLGAPGVFANPDPKSLAALEGKRVFNAVGELDTAWQEGVAASHQALLDAGIDSTLFEMPGQDHILSKDFDESVFFAFWSER